MAKLIINRKPGFGQRLRRFDVYIDGSKAGEVSKGAAEEFTVNPGRHTVEAKLGWHGSNRYEVEISGDEVKFLAVGTNMKGFWFFYTLLLAALFAPILFRSAGLEKSAVFEGTRVGVLIVVSLYFFYKFIIRRKTYLKIEEDRSNIFNT